MTTANNLASLGNSPAFSAYQSGTATLSNDTWTKLPMNTEEFDTNSCYDTTLYRFQPTVTGYYQVNGSMFINSATYMQLKVYKNGSPAKAGVIAGGTAAAVQAITVSALIYLNGSSDYVELYGYQSSGASRTTDSGSQDSYFQASMVRGA